jgi:hypothetical protein
LDTALKVTIIFMKYGKPSDMITVNDDPSSVLMKYGYTMTFPSLLNPMSSFYFTTLFWMAWIIAFYNPMRVAKSKINWKKELYKTVARNPDNASDKYEVPSGFNRHAEEWLQDL